MATVGTGTTIAFASGFFAEILSVSGPNASRVSIPTSHMGTTSAHTFTPGDLVDWGELTVELAFDPSATPPIASSSESVVINFPDSDTSTWTMTGFMTAFSPSTPFEERATASATIKITGAVVIT